MRARRLAAAASASADPTGPASLGIRQAHLLVDTVLTVGRVGEIVASDVHSIVVGGQTSTRSGQDDTVTLERPPRPMRNEIQLFQ